MSKSQGREDLAEEVAWQLKCGQGWGPAMQAVGYTNPNTLAKRLHRAGRHDLAAIFEDQSKAA